MISLFENNKEVEEINVYFIYIDVNDNNLKTLETICVKYGRKFIPIPFHEICYDLNISQVGRHIETIYTKVFFSRIVNLDKVLYLDSDTIITKNISDLWDTNLDGCYLGAVETFTQSKTDLGLSKNARFFNDGITLVNVKYCRDNKLIEKVLSVISEYDGNPPVLSEGALNKVCYGRVKYLSLRYNLMAGLLYYCRLDSKYLSTKLKYTEEDLIDSCNNPSIIHFLTAFYNRPWFVPCTHPYKAEYFKYKEMSPWHNQPIVYKPIPWRIRCIDYLNRILGYKMFDRIHQLIKYKF